VDFQASYPAPVDDLVDLTSTGQLECHSTSILMASKPDPASAFRALAERDLLNTYRCWLSTHLSFPFPVNSQIDFPPYTRIRLISETKLERNIDARTDSYEGQTQAIVIYIVNTVVTNNNDRTSLCSCFSS
jgi:hypothetical protein